RPRRRLRRRRRLRVHVRGAGDSDHRRGRLADQSVGDQVRNPIREGAVFTYRSGGNFRPVKSASAARAVNTAAKVTCAVSAVVAAERKPMPITGTELPANIAIM